MAVFPLNKDTFYKYIDLIFPNCTIDYREEQIVVYTGISSPLYEYQIKRLKEIEDKRKKDSKIKKKKAKSKKK